MKKIILTISAFGALSLGAVATNTNLAKADGLLPRLSKDSFFVKSASVRLADDDHLSGIRFKTVMDKEVYDVVMSRGTRTGTLMAPTDEFEGDLTKEYCLGDVDTTKAWVAATYNNVNYMESAAIVYDIPATHFATKLAVRSYVEIGDSIYYSEQKEVAMTDIANAEINNPNSTFSSSEKKKLSAYISFSVLIDGEPVRAAYGEKLVKPDDPVMEGNEFDDWYIKDTDTKWDFDNDVVTEETEIVSRFVFDGDGSETNPFLIKNKAQWDIFTNKVNSGECSYAGKFVKLTADIEGVDTMVGVSSDVHFKGSFDGGNHTITANISTTAGQFIGLFLYNEASMKNFRLEGSVSINKGGYGAGCVAYNLGVLENVTNAATVTGISRMGGVVAFNRHTMVNCVNEGSVICQYISGGVCGVMEDKGLCETPSIINCENKGTVRLYNTIDVANTAYTAKFADGDTKVGYSIGGILGHAASKNALVKGCTNNGAVSGIGSAYNNDGYKTGYIGVGGIVGGSLAPIVECTNNGKILAAFHYGGIVGNTSNEIRGCVNNAQVARITSKSTATYGGGIVGCLYGGKAVDCNNTRGVWATVYGGGIAGIATTGSTIENCDFLDSQKEGVNGTQSLGGIIGEAGANCGIKDCENVGLVTSNSTGASGNAAGGICGTVGNNVTIEGCSNSGKVTCGIAGGILGMNGSAATGCSIKNCVSSGEFSCGNVDRCGAFVGWAKTATTVAITGSTNNTTVTRSVGNIPA